MASGTSSTTTQTVTRTELYWLLAAVVFGSFVRLSFPGRMAVEHFDEGVYASNFWFEADDDYSYPARYLYAPPLLPAAIEWTMTIASLCGVRPIGFIPMIPCLIAGIAMIPSMWWVCRQWFGSTSGLVSAWLVATSDFHACYSRAALTDVPVCLFILWGVYFTGRALLKSSFVSIRETGIRRGNAAVPSPLPWREILLAACFTGLAWWTKYNGWLPLAIGLTAAVVWQWLTPRAERQIFRVSTCWLAIAIAATAVWLPVLSGVQKSGGYAKVAANHRQYVVGLNGWGKSAVSQMYNIGFYEDPLDILVRPLTSHFEPNRGSAQEQRWWRLKQHLQGTTIVSFARAGQWRYVILNFQEFLFGFVTPLFVPVVSLILSLLFCASRLTKTRQPGPPLADCLVASWLVGLTVATPFYHPYPRLVLPWLCATWVCLGIAAHEWTIRVRPSVTPLTSWKWKSLVIGMISISLIRLACGWAHVWIDRTSVQSASLKFAATVKAESARSGFPENEAIVYVYGEPAMVFGMRAAGLPATVPAQNLGFMQGPIVRPTFVAFPPRGSAMSSDDREELQSWRFERADGFAASPSHLVLLDDQGFNSWTGSNEIKLFRFTK